MHPSARLLPLLLLAGSLVAATYEVGPAQTYVTIGAVPWESLNAGDTVRIHYKATPYYEKFAINRIGTQLAPITVTGVPDGSGNLPMISGLNATTRAQLSYYGRQRSVIKIGQADAPAAWIVLENLDISRAQGGGTYTAPSGATETYTNAASSIYVETADQVTIRNCVIHDSSNGLFSAYGPSTAILVTGCYIYGNGRSGSVYEHNVYTESRGITFENNRFGPLGAGCLGNNLKDRSAGTVVRYNWIEGGNRQLDLVESADFADIRNDPAYRTTHVYGNVLVEPAGDGNRQIIHYGGDNGDESQYRKGTLHLYDNTLVSKRTDRTVLVMLDTAAEGCNARNNILYVTAAGSTLALLEDVGTLTLANNWLKIGFTNSVTGGGTVSASGNVTGAAPGFVNEAGQDYHLASGSPCIGGATTLDAAVLPSHNVVRQYVSHRQSIARGDVLDLGAFIRSGSNAAPVVSAAGATPSPVIATTTALSATASDDAGEAALTYTWSGSPGTVSFSPNGTNAAKSSTATFTAAGTYTLTVTARDAGALTGTRTVSVTVQQTPTTLSVSPAVASVATGGTATLNATVRNQFNAAIAGPTVTWAVIAGGGSVNASGVYTAPASTGTASVRATSGALSATATLTITTGSTTVVSNDGGSAGSGGGCGVGALGMLVAAGMLAGAALRRR